LNKIVTRGFGRNSTKQGIITQGYGGVLSTVIRAVATATRHVVAHGKSAASRVRKEIDDAIVRVTLISVNDKFIDLFGQEHGTVEKFDRPRVTFTLLKKRTIELIRLSAKRVK
jgi:hypothetical protein